ncbi:MAG TPA: hypothetical protein PKM27_02215 [Saprospiraceae bacterium]|nr:hypothetical protein [Saprospiraceae bacterium]HNT20635.1 hypothetical protein [Saprospiraceae bacterium]
MNLSGTGRNVKRTIYYLTAVLCIAGIAFECSNQPAEIRDPLERNLVLAAGNRPELEKVIDHFRKDPDSLKLKATLLLLSNMEDKFHYSGEWLRQADSLFFSREGGLGEEDLQLLRDSVYGLIGSPAHADIRKIQDLQHLTSSYLIQNIEDAFESWQKAPWKEAVSFDAFCNYILPYKSYNEYPENWRPLLRARYNNLLLENGVPQAMEDICCALVDEEKKWLKYSEEPRGYPGALSISSILKLQKGSCVEWSAYGAEAARAFGIPVAIDYVPQYGNRYSTHKWNALVLSDTSFLSFLGAESRPGDHAPIREGETKFAKVFRWRLGADPESFAVKARKAGIKAIPPYLEDPRIKDVTAHYTLVSDLSFEVKGDPGMPLYLCVFKNWDWEAIAGGLIDQDKVRFPQMGRAVLYMPMFYQNGRYRPAGPPVGLMADNKIQVYRPGGEGNLVLKRKYPFKRTEEWLREHSLQNARFEGSHDPEFTKPALLYYVLRNVRPYRGARVNNLALKDQWLYDSLWREAPVRHKDSFQYVRLLFKKGNEFRLGEIEFYADGKTRPLSGKILGNIPQAPLAFDGFPGKCIKLPKDTSQARWVGLDLGKKTAVEKIRFIPADDDNFVEAGQTYELFYWKDKWVSAGKQKALSDSLEYQKVPQGTVYLLRCWDCNNLEERPFTYEGGKQIWW